jgi:hypothetical protein
MTYSAGGAGGDECEREAERERRLLGEWQKGGDEQHTVVNLLAWLL